MEYKLFKTNDIEQTCTYSNDYITYSDIKSRSFEFHKIHIKIGLSLVKNVVRFLLHSGYYELESTVHRFNALDVRETKRGVHINGT